MSFLQTIQVSHLPASLQIHAALYRDLKNASLLREQLLSGNSEFEYAFLDASSVLSTTHALAAVFRAINDSMNERLKSRNVHSETVFAFSPNNNIAESFRKFGITDATKELLVIKISTSPEITHDSVAQHLDKNIEGTTVPFDDEHLSQMADVAKIRKIYKLNTVPNKPGKGEPIPAPEVENKMLEKSIIGLIALRGAA